MRKVKFHSQALNQEFEVGRIIGEYHGEEEGPVLVFFGGVHGNEPAGVVALMRAMEMLDKLKPAIRGSIYAICGNMSAMEKGERFNSMDLNRIWTRDRIKRIEEGYLNEEDDNLDCKEQRELFQIGKDIFAKYEHQVYCIDIHTTSADSIPFIAINDTLINRSFSAHFPVPVVLGIEEFLTGPLLNWIMEIGYPCLAFEAGSHHTVESIENAEAFVCLSLVYAGLIKAADLPDHKKYLAHLEGTNFDQERVFEVRYKREVSPEDNFKMNPGYVNFQPIQKDEALAVDKSGDLKAPENGRIFMPLYQSQGGDGYFGIREIAPFWLSLSGWLREAGFESILTLLPGVNRDPKEHFTLIVNKQVAKFLAVEIFHLLGYRNKEKTEKELRFSRREYDVRGIAKYQ